MSPEHILAVEVALGKRARSTTGRINVLEYGSGLSTIYFANYLHSQGYDISWTALEADASWRNALLTELKTRPLDLRKSIHIPTFNYGSASGLCDSNFQDSLKKQCLDEYISWPKKQKYGIKYHVVLVDGRKRARCIKVARKSLVKDGIIILHDAQRPYYHSACEGLETHKVKDDAGEELWVMRKSTLS